MYSFLSRWVSQAVRPANTITPTTDTMNCSIELARNRLTRLAMMMPNRPMIRNDPIPLMSRLVVYPYRLSAPNVAAVMKNTRTIEVCVYTRKIDDSEIPIKAENTQNSIWAVAGRSRSMPAEITNTMASGARMNSHFSGLTNIA